MPEQTAVQLTIFNLLGQEIRTLVKAVQPPGYHEVVWDGCDRNGVAVGSGVYLYRLTTNGFTETRRMMLLK
ncbi:MAG: T9SS type A sorting domain-containing protein [candidate division Zixibacteria bacterium]|nr:T9SS type A sorting domain-containing protein [candidate division Zixibacteria bacterium]